MSTKTNPGAFDCYANALPDEPMFILLARDPEFGNLVRRWARHRDSQIQCGERPPEDRALVLEALECAASGEAWRRDNLGKWRKQPA